MQADARPKRKRSGDATANRDREQKRRDLLKAERTARLKKLMAVVLCVTTECTPGKKTATALVVEKATLFLVVERLEQELAKSGGGGGLEVGVRTLVTRAATEACLLGDTRRWLDPLTEMRVAKRQLQKAAKEVEAWGGRRGSGQLELELTTVVSRRRKMLAPKNRNATLERQPAAVGGEADGTGRRGTGGNAAGDAEGAGGVRQKRGARHSKAHFKQVSRDWLAQTAKSRYRSGSRFRVSKEQAEQLHRVFWQFCSYQRRVRRLQREIDAAGGWQNVSPSTDDKEQAQKVAAYNDLRTRSVVDGAIRMRGPQKDKLFWGLALDAVAGYSPRQVVTQFFTLWRKLAGGKKLSQI